MFGRWGDPLGLRFFVDFDWRRGALDFVAHDFANGLVDYFGFFGGVVGSAEFFDFGGDFGPTFRGRQGIEMMDDSFSRFLPLFFGERTGNGILWEIYFSGHGMSIHECQE